MQSEIKFFQRNKLKFVVSFAEQQKKTEIDAIFPKQIMGVQRNWIDYITKTFK